MYMSSHPLENTGLAIRDSSCSNANSIQNTLNDIEAALSLINVFDETALIIIWAPALADLILASTLGGTAIALVGATALVLLAVLLACGATQNCKDIPSVLAGFAQLVATTAGGAAIANWGGATEALTAGVGSLSAIAVLLLDFERTYLQDALQCCAVNCGGSVCQQAGLGCILTLHTDGKGLDCAAQ